MAVIDIRKDKDTMEVVLTTTSQERGGGKQNKRETTATANLFRQ
jgi:hypothetical protein